MTNSEPRVFAIVPAYNEEARVRPVLQSLVSRGYQTVVVDDGSADRTWDVVAVPGVYRLRHPINRGQGAALQTGIAFALRQGADYLVTFDADGQHSVDDIPAMLAPLKSGECDVTLGSRFLGSATDMPWRRRLLLRAGVIFTGLVSGMWLTDTHNGLRAFTRKAAAQLSISLDGMAHASEIIHTIKHQRLRYKEVAVTIRYNREVLEKGQSNLNAVRIAFRFLTYLITR